MLFKFDENLPVQAAALFRAAGHNAATVLDQGMKGFADEAIAQVCGDERRALVTLDVDFADITAYPPGDYPGIIVLRLQQQDVLSVLDVLRRLLPVFDSESPEQKLWIVDEDRIRIRE